MAVAVNHGGYPWGSRLNRSMPKPNYGKLLPNSTFQPRAGCLSTVGSSVLEPGIFESVFLLLVLAFPGPPEDSAAQQLSGIHMQQLVAAVVDLQETGSDVTNAMVVKHEQSSTGSSRIAIHSTFLELPSINHHHSGILIYML